MTSSHTLHRLRQASISAAAKCMHCIPVTASSMPEANSVRLVGCCVASEQSMLHLQVQICGAN